MVEYKPIVPVRVLLPTEIRDYPKLYFGLPEGTKAIHYLLKDSVDCLLKGNYGFGIIEKIINILVVLHKDRSISFSDDGPAYLRDTVAWLSGKKPIRDGNIVIRNIPIITLSCEWLNISVRNNKLWGLKFAHGIPLPDEIVNEPPNGFTNHIHLMPEQKFFGNSPANFYWLCSHLRSLAIIKPGVRIQLIDHQSNLSTQLEFKHGIVDLLRDIGAHRTFCSEPLFMEGAVGKDQCRIALQWCHTGGIEIQSYIQGSRTQQGGSHENGFWEGLAIALGVNGPKKGKLKRNLSLSCIVFVLLDRPPIFKYSRDSVEDPDVFELVAKVVSEKFQTAQLEVVNKPGFDGFNFDQLRMIAKE